MKLPVINKEKGLIILVILLFGAWIGVKLFTPVVEDSTTIEETISVDTTFNTVDTSFTEKATKKRRIKPKSTTPTDLEKDPEPEKYDSIRHYAGTYHFDYGKFDWSINTGGVLNGYTFTPIFEIPTVATQKEKTITQTKTIIQRGLFAGAGMNTLSQFHVGATYLGKNFLIEYNFVPKRVQTIQYGGIHQVGFKYKIL